MRCICCLSNRIIPRPLALEGYFRCLSCGLVFAGGDKKDDTRENLISHYQDVDPYEKVENSRHSFFNSTLEHISSKIKKNKKTILDVGCGYGYFLELASGKGWNTSGVEIMDITADYAKEKLGDQKIFHGTLREAKYPDNSFDVITLWDVLFIVENPFEELKDCYRVLNKGGIIGIRVRNLSFQKIAYWIYSFLKKIEPQLKIKKPHVFHRYCFSSQSIYQLLHRIGFTNIKVANSPLTKGDPYSYALSLGLVKAAKITADFYSRLGFWISGGRWVIGPSLLVWAEKPQSILKRTRENLHD